MNDKFTNNTDDESIARKLNQIAEQTHANGQFAAELEEKLRSAHQPQRGWFAIFAQISPTLRWVALMILLAIVLSWSIRSLVPAPQPAINDTPVLPAITTSTPSANILPDVSATPITQGTGYNFRGAKLFLGLPLPDSPATAHVYVLNKQDQQATLEQARALADRFGIQGDVYTEPTYIFDTTNYVFSDGKQSLSVYSPRFFSYVSDLSKISYTSRNIPNENAEAIIREFLQARGFDFSYRITASDFFDGYIVQPLAPDSLPMQYESFTPPSMVVMLDETGAVLRVDAMLMDYDPTHVGEYGIISVQEALDKLLDDSLLGGKTEFVHSSGRLPHEWVHIYPDDQPVTAYGHITTYPAADPGKPALVLMDGVPVTGNTQGLESLDHYTLIKANGQYFVENGIRKLNVESWDSHVTETPVTGTLSRHGDGILLTSDDGSGQQYELIDPPVDAPLNTKVPETQLSVVGVIADGKMYWTYIQFFEDNSGGGGGGGGGLGFYKLNLSGPPVPFPTLTPKPHANAGGSEYVVKEGDTVLAIAQLHGLSPEKILDANPGLEGGVLTPGKILIIPATYVVQENDTLASIALNFGISVEALMQANGITENQVFTGQTLVIPSSQPSVNDLPIGIYVVQEGDTLTAIAQNYKTSVDELIGLNNLADPTIYVGQPLSVPIPEDMKQRVEDARGYLTVTIHNQVGGISNKEYTLEVAQNSGGVSLYTLDGSMLGELDPYNGLPILISGTLDPLGKLVVESYKIPFPDLHFQILKGLQKEEQLGGQNVVIFTTEDGNSYVEFLATNNQPTGTFTGNLGELVQQEVLIIPDETFAGMPVAHIYQSAIVQENSTELQVQANQIHVFNDGSDPASSGVYVQPNLTISRIELVYFVSNPYYQVNDPNYDQRSPYIQPVWHFHGRFDDGTEFDMLVQALKEEFLLPELAPNAGMG